MLHRHEIILERLRLLFGAGQHFINGLGHVYLRRVYAPRDFRNARQLPFDGKLHGARRDRQFSEEPGHDAILLRDERREEVPRIDLGVVETTGKVLRVGHRLTRHLGEFGEVHGGSSIAQTEPVGDGVVPHGRFADACAYRDTVHRRAPQLRDNLARTPYAIIPGITSPAMPVRRTSSP